MAHRRWWMDVFFEEAGREGGRQNWQDRNLKKKNHKVG